MRKAIVTGATGFLGKALVRYLAEEGAEEIYAVVRDMEKAALFQDLPQVRFILCPLDIIETLPKFIEGRDIDAFYHFAWEGTSGEKRGDYSLQMMNIQGTLKALEAAEILGCTRFLYAGSLMEYESMKFIPCHGNTPREDYIYRSAKLAAHFMAKALSCHMKIRFVSMTISNIYGEGELSGRMVSTYLRKFIKGERSSFTSGQQLYDFMYLEDAVKAFVLLGEKGEDCGEYYIGSPEPRKLVEYLYLMRDCVNRELELGIGEVEFNGVSLSYEEFDRGRLYRDFNFCCETDFETGIQRTAEWLKKHM